MAIEVVKSKNPIDMKIDEFILWYLRKPGTAAYVREMMDAYNGYRLKSSTKRLMKYTSFRTIVCNLAAEGCIVLDHHESSGRGFDKAYYRLTGQDHNPGWKRR